MKPMVEIKDLKDWDIFNMLELAQGSLANAGQAEQLVSMTSRVLSSQSYSDSKLILQDYVDFK